MNARGQELLARHLCGYTPVQGKRLVAGLKGVQVIHSFEHEGSMELTLQVPRQVPTCEVRDVPIAPARTAEPSVAAPTEAPATVPADPPAGSATRVPAAAASAARASPAAAGAPEGAAPIKVRRQPGEY
jgi:hypothetical protein